MKKLIFAFTCLFLAIPCRARIITVDDDGPADFNTIQAAIDDSNDGDTIIVRNGTYTGDGNRDIDFLGKAVTVRSTDPNDWAVVAATVIDCQYNGRGFTFYSEGPDSILAGFTITKGYDWGGGIKCQGSSPTITNCVIINNFAPTNGNLYGNGAGILGDYGSPTIRNCIISGNQATGSGGGVWWYKGSPIINNCTVSNNSAMNDDGGGIFCFGSVMTVHNCILWDNTAKKGPQICLSGVRGHFCPTITVSYGDIQGGKEQIYIDGCGNVNWGPGNIDVDPLFADAASGDYHLKSQSGRWETVSQVWVQDGVTSPCIDTGNPGCPLGDEPNDVNNIRINIGAYGGTAEASKSPASWALLADLTNDQIVNFNDLNVFVHYWLDSGVCIPSDLNRSELVDFEDFALTAYHWLEDGNVPFLLPPGQAIDPDPIDGDTGVGLDTTLSWTAGSGAKSHNVYFGTEQSPPFQCNQTHTIFDPGILELKKTYYWRIDEIGTSAKTTGNVWNFTTRDFEPCNDPNIVGCWKFDEDSGFTAHDSSGNNNHGILIENTVSWAPTEGVFAGAVRFDGDGPNDNINSPCRIEIPTVGMKVSTGTVALWANITEPPPADIGERYNDRFFFCCQGSGASDRLYLWMSYFDNWLDVKIGSKVLFNNRHLSANTWHHIVLTWHRGVYSVYVDGHETYTTTYGNLNSLPSIAVIGNNSSHTASFHGLIDEVMILNRRLYAPEILFIYQEGSN